MQRLRRLMKEEKGAGQMIEAILIYPFVFLIIFLMIYIGLYILQSVTLGVYAQKVAVLAAREISEPGYRTLIEDSSKYSSTAVELDVDGNGETYEGISVNVDGIANEMTNNFTVVYRYWGNPLNEGNTEYYTNIMKTLVNEKSLIRPMDGGKVEVSIDCKNNLIAQFVTVEVEQELMDFPILQVFGIENPTIGASATSTVSDTDELIRTTDFVADAMSALASKLGIDTSNLRENVSGALKKLGLVSG